MLVAPGVGRLDLRAHDCDPLNGHLWQSLLRSSCGGGRSCFLLTPGRTTFRVSLTPLRKCAGKLMDRRYYVDIKLALQGEDRMDDAVVSVPGDGVVRANFGKGIVPPPPRCPKRMRRSGPVAVSAAPESA